MKDENIIVFMYDDIALDEENPRPGVIINSPHGDDVYKGVPKVCFASSYHIPDLLFLLDSGFSTDKVIAAEMLNSSNIIMPDMLLLFCLMVDFLSTGFYWQMLISITLPMLELVLLFCLLVNFLLTGLHR